MQMKIRSNYNKYFWVDIGDLRKGTIKINAMKDDKPFSYSFDFDLSKTTKYKNKDELGRTQNEFIIPFVAPPFTIMSYQVMNYGTTTVIFDRGNVVINTDTGTDDRDGFVPPLASGYWKSNVAPMGCALSHQPGWNPSETETASVSNDFWPIIHDDKRNCWYTFNLAGYGSKGQWPIIYQSKNQVDWFMVSDYPVKGQTLVDKKLYTEIVGIPNIWSGSVFIDTKDRFGFGANSVIWFISLPAGGNGGKFFGAWKDPNVDSAGWMVSKSIFEVPYQGGILYASKDIGSFRDPRYTITPDNRFLVQAPGCPMEYNTEAGFWGSNHQTYYVFNVEKLVPGGSAVISEFRSIMDTENPDDRVYHAREVAGLGYLKDEMTDEVKSIMMTSAQMFEKAKWNEMPSPRWNSLVNSNVWGFTDFGINSYDEKKDERKVDIGLDVYASAFNSDGVQGKYFSGGLNWGTTRDVPQSQKASERQSTPVHKVRLVNGKLRYNFIEGISYQVQPIGSDIKLVGDDGSTLTRLYNRNNRCVLDWNGTVLDKFQWKTSKYDWSRKNVYGRHLDTGYMQFPLYDQLKEIHYYICQNPVDKVWWIYSILKGNENEHDFLFSARCVDHFKINGIDGTQVYSAPIDNYKSIPDNTTYFYEGNTLSKVIAKK